MKNSQINLNDMVGKFVNRYLYTDVQPVGQIVAIKGKSTLVLRKVIAGDNKSKMEFVPGGFSAVCLNNWNQDYDYEITDEIIEMRYSKGFLKQYRIENEPYKHYDYNF